MFVNHAAYLQALHELSALLEAPQPPPLASAEADRFEYLLEMVELYESVLTGPQ